jgi:Cu/Ag efflux protein CusF
MLDLVLRQRITILYHDTIKMLDLDKRKKITIVYHDTIKMLDLVSLT